MSGEFCTELVTFLPGCESRAGVDSICIGEDNAKRHEDSTPICAIAHQSKLHPDVVATIL